MFGGDVRKADTGPQRDARVRVQLDCVKRPLPQRAEVGIGLAGGVTEVALVVSAAATEVVIIATVGQPVVAFDGLLQSLRRDAQLAGQIGQARGGVAVTWDSDG